MKKYGIALIVSIFFFGPLFADYPTGSTFESIAYSLWSPVQWVNFSAATDFTLTFRLNLTPGDPVFMFIRNSSKTYRINLQAQSSSNSTLFIYNTSPASLVHHSTVPPSTLTLHSILWHRLRFSGGNVKLARSLNGTSGWTDYLNVNLGGMSNGTGYGFSSQVPDSSRWVIMSNLSFALGTLSLAEFNANASSYESNISSMTLEQLNATTTSSLQITLQYNKLTLADQSTANSTITNLLNQVIARRNPLNMAAFLNSAHSYKLTLPGMSTTALNALSTTSVRTELDYDILGTSDKSTADKYVNEILALRDELVATPGSMTWTSVDGEPSRNKQATLGSRTFYYRPCDPLISTATAASANAALTSTQPGAPNYHWHYDLLHGSPLSTDMSGFLAGGCAAIDCSTKSYNYRYDPLYPDTVTGPLWRNQIWKDHSKMNGSILKAVAWRYDATTTTWRREKDEDFSGSNKWSQSWTYNPSTKKWSHIIRGSIRIGTGAEKTYEWKYNNDNQRWTNLTLGEVWEYKDSHVWVQIAGDEQRWFVSDGTNSGFYVDITAHPTVTNAGEAAITVGGSKSGFWNYLEAFWYHGNGSDTNPIAINAFPDTEKFQWLASEGGARGQYRHTDTFSTYNTHFEYDASGNWTRTAGSTLASTYRLPPLFFPPFAVVQHQEVISVFEDLLDQSMWSAPPSSLNWTDQGSNLYTGVVAKQRSYRHKPDTAYNHTTSMATMTGQLTGNAPEYKWAFDTTNGSPISNVKLGNWSFLTGSLAEQASAVDSPNHGASHDVLYSFKFDAETQSFAPHDWAIGAGSAARKAVAQWTYTPATKTWTNDGIGETWAYNTETKRWNSTIPTYDSGTLTQEWSFNHDTKEWTNHTFSDTWMAHSPTHFSRGDYHTACHAFSGAVWVDLAPWGDSRNVSIAAQFILDTPGEYRRFFGETGLDYELHQSTGAVTGPTPRRLEFRAPTESHPRGIWYLDYETEGTDNDLYYYNETTDIWESPTYWMGIPFPHHLPPIPVSVHQDMISAYETLSAAGFASSIIELPEPVEWTANGRSYAHLNEMSYDTVENTAPLKVTTADTQLLHDLDKNPNFTQLGKWQFKDTTNGHVWTFNPTTGTWQNGASGYAWKYSKNSAGQWYQETVENNWTFDPNTQIWSQSVTQAS